MPIIAASIIGGSAVAAGGVSAGLSGGGGVSQRQFDIPPVTEEERMLQSLAIQEYLRRRQQALGLEGLGTQATGGLRNILATIFDADPNQDPLRNLIGGRELDVIRDQIRGLENFQTREQGTESIARRLVEQGLEDPFRLSPTATTRMDELLSENRKILEGERDLLEEDLERRLAGRFGPGFESTGPFLAEEERFVSRPYQNALSQLLVGDIQSRLGGAQFSREFERGVLGDVRGGILNASSLINSASQNVLNARLGLTQTGIGTLSGLTSEIPRLQAALGSPLDVLSALETSRLRPTTIQAGAPFTPNQPSAASQLFGGASQGLGQLSSTLLASNLAARNQERLQSQFFNRLRELQGGLPGAVTASAPQFGAQFAP